METGSGRELTTKLRPGSSTKSEDGARGKLCPAAPRPLGETQPQVLTVPAGRPQPPTQRPTARHGRAAGGGSAGRGERRPDPGSRNEEQGGGEGRGGHREPGPHPALPGKPLLSAEFARPGPQWLNHWRRAGTRLRLWPPEGRSRGWGAGSGHVPLAAARDLDAGAVGKLRAVGPGRL